MLPGRGLSVNGKLLNVKAKPWVCREIKTGWVPKRLRLAVFFETGRLWSPGKPDHGKRTSGWLAADLRGYHMGQGDTPAEAIRSLLLTIWMEEDDTDAEARREEKRHTRWHVERGAEGELAEMEAKARKNGFILEGVDWRASLAALGGVARVEQSFAKRARKCA
jgi:hypothetical protein